MEDFIGTALFIVISFNVNYGQRVEIFHKKLLKFHKIFIFQINFLYKTLSKNP